MYEDGLLALEHGLDGGLGNVGDVDGQWGVASLGGHLGAHLARAHNQHVGAGAAQGLAQVDVEAVHAGLGGAVDKVGTAHAHACHGGHSDDGAVALVLELLAQEHAYGHRCGVVGLCGGDGLVVVLPQLFLVTQGAEGNDGHVDVAAFPGFINNVWVGVEVGGIEVQDLYVSAAGFQVSLGLGDARGLRPGGQGDLGGAALQELGDDTEADLRGAAQKQDVLCLAYCIKHGQ